MEVILAKSAGFCFGVRRAVNTLPDMLLTIALCLIAAKIVKEKN